MQGALVLTRRVNEGVWIGDGIRVVVLKIAGDRVRLGFQAPNGELILRDELRAKQGLQRCEIEDDLRPYPETVVKPKKGDVL